MKGIIDGPGLICDVLLAGDYQGDVLGGLGDPADTDYRLWLRGLEVSLATLARLVDQLDGWLALPPARLLDDDFGLACVLGELHGQRLSLELGRRMDTLAGPHPVASLAWVAGRLGGTLRFPVAVRNLAEFRDGLQRALETVPGA